MEGGHHVAGILAAALEGVSLALVVDADDEGLPAAGSRAAIVVDLVILTVLLVLHL